MFGLSWLKIGIGLGLLLLGVGGAFAIKAGVDKIAKQGAQIARMEIDLASEKVARERDVAGLTTLAQGMIEASSARAIDERALGESIDANNPKPVSPDLAAFLDRLRSGQVPPATTSPAGRTR